MIKVNVNLGERSYPIYIGGEFASLARVCSSHEIKGKAVIVADSNVAPFYTGELSEILKNAGVDIYKYVFEAGEKNKNLDTIRDLYSFFLDKKLERSSTVFALGGGVTGDITGFAAATYLRGIRFAQIPTTLLAQSDSSVGGKVGVDFNGVKNIVGAFYQPDFVFMNVNTLKTLPDRELKAGLAEVIKHGIIRDADFFEYIEYNIKRIFQFNEEILTYLTKTNCRIKAAVVEEDEKENDLRAILNFGHTTGHAIESISDFNLLHGECVSIGMAAACSISNRMGFLEEKDMTRIRNLLVKAGLPVTVKGVKPEKVYEKMFSDKKISSGKLRFVLPKSIGDVFIMGTVPEEIIMDALNEVCYPDIEVL